MKHLFKLKFLLFFPAILSMILFQSCMKEWLDEKSDKKVVIPRNLQDMQALLDNTSIMNNGTAPVLGEVSTDDYYVDDNTWETLPKAWEKNAYIWSKAIYEDPSADISDWSGSYQQIYYANLVLEELEKVEPDLNERELQANIRGSALFFRAWTFYQLAQIFCEPYDETTSNASLGIPLRLTSDIEVRAPRATVAQTYEQILKDLEMAVGLLPSVPLVKTRPAKPAAYGLLAKTHLVIGDFNKALLYADSCLSLQHELMDYNELDLEANYPLKQFNKEVIFSTTMSYAYILSNSRINVDSRFYNSYHQEDLRKTIFFFNRDDRIAFRGSYNESSSRFAGIATDEIYLIRAECYARRGNLGKALRDLNWLLQHRIEVNAFEPLLTNDPNDVLRIILAERRKELIFRGIRWSDLRRLNKDPAFSKTLERSVNGQLYTLPPLDARYVLPIPLNVIELGGIEQNTR